MKEARNRKQTQFRIEFGKRVRKRRHDLGLSLILCSKYLDKTFNFFDSKILKSEACSNIQQWMISEILKTFGEEPSKKES